MEKIGVDTMMEHELEQVSGGGEFGRWLGRALGAYWEMMTVTNEHLIKNDAYVA